METVVAPAMTRDVRQKILLPGEVLSKQSVAVIGCGAVGRQVALQLAAMGVGYMRLYDFDTIGIENMSSQGWRPADIGKKKVLVLADDMHAINPDITFDTIEDRWSQSEDTLPVTFCCVDNMDTRKVIWERHAADQDTALLFLDTRMAAEVFSVYAACRTDQRSPWRGSYEESLFPQSEAFQGTCTRQSTIYCANAVAAVAIAQYTKWLRGGIPDRQVEFNLLTTDLSVTIMPKATATAVAPTVEEVAA